MKNSQSRKKIDKALINIYNILAILIVIIPELLAEIIYSFEMLQHNNVLPNEGKAWKNDTELKLSRMNIYELRVLAKKLSIHGYSNENRNSLIKRLKWKIRQKKFMDIIK